MHRSMIVSALSTRKIYIYANQDNKNININNTNKTIDNIYQSSFIYDLMRIYDFLSYIVGLYVYFSIIIDLSVKNDSCNTAE